jgi:tRNA G18 (ribose-2'-O)-methylase SpoU
MQVIRITDLHAPVLQPYLTLRRPKEHHRQGLFVAEGRLVVERLLQTTGYRVRSVLTMPQWLARLEALLAERGDVPVYVAERKEIQQIVGFSYHAGLLALAECPAEPSLVEALTASPAACTWLALDDLTHAENVGVMARNAAALGAEGMVVGPTTASPFLRRAVRNSLGGVFVLRIHHSPDLADALRVMQAGHGFRVIGADANGGTPLECFRIPARSCLVFGHEEHGLSAEIRDRCEACVQIPMEGGLDSLNVASAGAILLQEARRQRGLG